jgi:hypothetical protein
MRGITGKSDVTQVAPRLIQVADCRYDAQFSAASAAGDVDVKNTG